MAIFALTDGRCYIGGYDLSDHIVGMNLNLTSEELDTTTINSGGYRSRQGGLQDAQFSANGYYEAGANKPDALLGASTGSEHIITVMADSGAGDTSYFFKATQFEYTLLGAVGELTPFNISASQSADKPVKATQMNDDSATITASGNTTARQIGAVSSTQSVYASIHVWSVAGTSTPTLTAKIQSDNGSGFSSPTDRITMTSATAITSEYKSLAGAITDDYWRVNWTVSGSSPIFKAIVSIGIA